ncbi:hypothetical protein GCM10010169_34450 [Micromonospora fulviviridis]|uniref:hypothetical protein n=1 Tax=Micromonospora fulviviridis TaxID=47860 RepID=UPI0016649D1E|nr:hypothetical protein [Micromonospora fulviviridis]GGR87326.1 hypothetical protein GCM10010169_34450 [Micromonospora fulviviridis]
MQEVVRRWWNGVWGRLTRRDVRLVRQTRWTVMARAGDTESGNVLRWEFGSEPQALEMVDRLLRADTAGQWREQDRGTSPPGTGAGAARRVT